jgi:hypothetical protein
MIISNEKPEEDDNPHKLYILFVKKTSEMASFYLLTAL